jgi:hypothetical protein
MMRKLIGVAVLVCMVSMLGLAQETPKPEVYGGYQFTRMSENGASGHASGWNSAANFYLTRWFGATGDFSGVYSNGASLYTYTFGPTVSTHKQGVSPFAHALFGGAHAGAAGFGLNGMAMMFGGGIDLGKQKLAFRAAQFDWLMLRSSGITLKNNIRVTTGLMYRF